MESEQKENRRLVTADVVIGLQAGDEGKGKVVQSLIQSEKYDVCARFNGGPNAGHTIYLGDKKMATHGIPTGIVYGSDALIGPGCAVDLTKLEKEIMYLEENGIEGVRGKLKLSYNAHLITEDAIEDDKLSDKVGTTLSGIGPTYAKKALRVGTRVNSLDKSVLEKLGVEMVDPSQFLIGKTILFEGAQGFELDPDWGDYPYVTSGGCLASHVLTCGIPHQSIRNVYGVCKIYATYVGSKKFMPDGDVELATLQALGKEFGVTTGRARQCNWLDLDRLLQAIFINGVNVVIMNKCDIIQTLDVYKLYYNKNLMQFDNLVSMQGFIEHMVMSVQGMKEIKFSSSALVI